MDPGDLFDRQTMNPHLLVASRILLSGCEAYALWIDSKPTAQSTSSVGQDLVRSADLALRGKLARADRRKLMEARQLGVIAVDAARTLNQEREHCHHYGCMGQDMGIQIIQAVHSNNNQVAASVANASRACAKRIRRSITKGSAALAAAQHARSAARQTTWANRDLLA